MRRYQLNAQICAVLVSVSLITASCTKSSDSKQPAAPPVVPPAEQSNPTQLIRSDYKAGEVTELCKVSIEHARQALDSIAAVPEAQRNTENTLLALENTTADLSDATTPLTFMGYISTDESVSAEGSACESEIGQFIVSINTRRDLYEAISKAVPRNAAEARLLQKTLEGFEQNGMKLSDEVLSQVRELKGQLSALETQFSTNLNQDHTTVSFSKDELQGVPADFIADLKVDEKGNLIVSADESTYPLVMSTAVKSEARKKMMLGYLNRAGDANTKILSDAVELRAKIAHLFGFQTWADYRTNGRMAQNSETVLDFLNGLKGKLAKRNQDDLAAVLKFKKEIDPTATTLNQWDISYYSTLLKKRDYSIDNEKIKEYFPADVVIAGLFQVYEKMFGVRYVQVTDAKVWAPDVKMYAIRDASDDHLIGYFYADFFPRSGKYDHAAAFPLISGRTLANGQYSQPVASIVANLSPPLNGKPSLLSYDDVNTIFHEFGHIMHQTLTRAPYASLSGSNTAQDFVEAPSQMLENWIANPEILKIISGHYLDHSQKLPSAMLAKLIETQDFNLGYSYTKQLTYALFDMTIHTQDGPVDVNDVYLNVYREVMGQEPLAGQRFPASFGHMMGGYDAGYYGYLWSEVYAEDMFTQFPKENLTSPEVGGRYRKAILEQGNMKDALELLRDFLGREPNSEAFFKKLHI